MGWARAYQKNTGNSPGLEGWYRSTHPSPSAPRRGLLAAFGLAAIFPELGTHAPKEKKLSKINTLDLPPPLPPTPAQIS